MLYDLDNPEDFDNLDGRDVAQFVQCITHQYYVTDKSVFDDHARIEDKVGEKSYLLYFHKMITATGAENVESLMKAELSAKFLRSRQYLVVLQTMRQLPHRQQRSTE